MRKIINVFTTRRTLAEEALRAREHLNQQWKDVGDGVMFHPGVKETA